MRFTAGYNDTNISDEDYDHAERGVPRNFGMRNMGEYHDLYLKTVVLQLADVFEDFWRFAMEKYGLDPCHYLTLPSLAWDAALKYTDVRLDLLMDIDQYLFCEAGIRGGISQITHRYAKANNPYIPTYDPSGKRYYIMYWDANNLYGQAMSQPMPVSDFICETWKLVKAGTFGVLVWRTFL